MLGDNLLRFNLKDKKLIFWDIESNSLHLNYTRPFEISYVIYNGYDLVKERQIFVNYPNYKIRPEIAKITHYDLKKINEIVATPKQAFNEILSYLLDDNYKIVFSNGLNYDCMVLHNSCKEVGIECGYKWLHRCYDINALFKGYKLGRKVDNNNLLSYQLGCNNLIQKGLKSNLQYMSKEFNIDMGGETEMFHGGLFDSRVTARIFFELIKKIDLE
jgi:DNA polymerase III epsilon subunit-like protein